MKLNDYEIKKNHDISFCKSRLNDANLLFDSGNVDDAIINVRVAIRAIKNYPDVVKMFFETLKESDCPEFVLFVADILAS